MSKIKIKSASLQTASSTQAKDTIYIDVDDEITAVIDKVTSSKAKIVALVLPKRATVMQSIVNMKLLKRTSEEAGKNIVLVTSEASLMPLAGLVKMHVASTPTSKPTVPPAPDQLSDEPERVDEPLDSFDAETSPADDFNPTAAAAVPVGVLAANEPESILMTDDPTAAESDAPDETANEAEEKTSAKPDKKLKVPSFNKFRLWLVFGVLAALLCGVGLYFALVVMPKASIAITTDSTTITTDLNITLDAAAKTLDADAKIIPATAQSVSKPYSQDAAATGQQNNGEKASGNVYFALKDCSEESVTIPTGSGVSVGGNTFITQSPLTLNSVRIGANNCNPTSMQSEWSGTIKVVAISGGAKYNIESGTTMTVGGGLNVSAKSNTTFTGGTDDIVKVLSQTDIDAAKDKISSQDTTQVKSELETSLKAKGLLPVPSTFLVGEQKITTSANAGDKVEKVTITATIPYTMLGIKQDDLKKLVLANVQSQIDTKKQKVLDDGINKAKFSQQNPGSNTTAIVAVKVRSTAGPELDITNLRSQVSGQKSGDIKEMLEGSPGITSVEVAYSPAWVSKAPKNTKKITIIVDGEIK